MDGIFNNISSYISSVIPLVNLRHMNTIFLFLFTMEFSKLENIIIDVKALDERSSNELSGP